MGIFDVFRKTDINSEVENLKGVEGAVLLDVRNEDEVKQLVDHTVDTFGGLDIFVNSAAIWNYAKVYDLPKEDLQLVFETNVYGAFYGVKHVSRYMIDHEVRGKIVLISSNSPIMPYPVFGGYPHYASSKAAVMGLTTEAAKELKRYGIMINSIAPGGMVTPGGYGADFAFVIDLIRVAEHMVARASATIGDLTGVGVSHQEYASPVRQGYRIHTVSGGHSSIVLDNLLGDFRVKFDLIRILGV